MKLLIRLALVGSLMTAAHAAQRFVSTAGNDTSGNGTIGNPYRTIGKATSLSSAGDTVSVRTGTYTQAIDDSSLTIPSGTSWANAFTIEAYNSEVVTIDPASGSHAAHFRFDSYIIIKDIIFNCDGVSEGWKVTEGAHHIRLQNCPILNTVDSHGILWSFGSDDGSLGGNEYLSGVISNIAKDFVSGNEKHCAYVQTPNNLISNTVMYGHDPNKCVWAIHNFTNSDGTNNVFINNDIRGPFSGALVMDTGQYNKAIGNRIYSQNRTGVGIRVSNGAVGHQIIGNTLFNTGDGINVGSGASGVTGTIVDNNIVSGTDDNFSAGIVITSGSTGAFVRNNLVYGCDGGTIQNNGSGSTLSNNLEGGSFNAHFTSTVWPYDLHIGATSSALNAGRTHTISSPDFDGDTRAQGNAYDIGADERIEGVIPPPPGGIPIVTISDFDQFAYEEASVDGAFTITRDLSTGTLAVNYRLTGTAVNGTDYATLATNVTFAAGQLSTNVIVNPTDDAIDEPDKTIIIDLWPDAAVYTLGTPTNATMTQIDNEQPPLPPPPPPVGDTNNASGGGSVPPRRRADIDAIEDVERAIAVARIDIDTISRNVKNSGSELSTAAANIRVIGYQLGTLYREQTNTNAQLKLIKTKLGIP